MGPEKGPQVHGSVWDPRKLGAIELLLQEYTLGRRAHSHELPAKILQVRLCDLTNNLWVWSAVP